MASQHDSVTLRQMNAGDFAAATEVWRDAFATSTEFPQSTMPPTATELAAGIARRTHLLRHDPGGSFVAEADDVIVGFAQSHRREGTFVLAMLAVSPKVQEAGIGQRLLDAALEYATGCGAAYIFSSSDPRAIHRYVRAGFTMHPAVQVSARRNSDLSCDRVRVSKGGPEDIAYVESIDRALRGSGRTVDVAYWLESGSTLLLHEENGYAVLSSDRLTALGAANDTVARELFGAVLSGYPDGVIRSASWIAAEQQWAIAEAAAQRATIEVHGSIMARGMPHLPYPYLPNGLFG
jgi:predicted N-acetyltransferase YhbS